MKEAFAYVLSAFLFCGCESMRQHPDAWGALAAGMGQAGEQEQQQQMLMNVQNQQSLARQREAAIEQQRIQQQNQGSSVYNPYTGTSEYVPPGWHSVWDANNKSWIIQPY
jgi:hypothetical protein